jgi:hypothetical protein
LSRLADLAPAASLVFSLLPFSLCLLTNPAHVEKATTLHSRSNCYARIFFQYYQAPDGCKPFSHVNLTDRLTAVSLQLAIDARVGAGWDFL